MQRRYRQTWVYNWWQNKDSSRSLFLRKFWLYLGSFIHSSVLTAFILHVQDLHVQRVVHATQLTLVCQHFAFYVCHTNDCMTHQKEAIRNTRGYTIKPLVMPAQILITLYIGIRICQSLCRWVIMERKLVLIYCMSRIVYLHIIIITSQSAPRLRYEKHCSHAGSVN